MNLNSGDKVLIRQCPCVQCSPKPGWLIVSCRSDIIGSVGMVIIGVNKLALLDVGDHGVRWFPVAGIVKIDGD